MGTRPRRAGRAIIAPMGGEHDAKTIVGYCEPLSLRGGGRVTLHASSAVEGPAEIDLVRIVCGDATRSGPGYLERPVLAVPPATTDLRTQPLSTGSWGEIDL